MLEVWEGSVRATHLFLSDDEIKSIKEYVPQALNGIAHLMIAEDESGRAVAFMGIEDGSLEMPVSYTHLPLAAAKPRYRGWRQGFGT